KAVDSGVLQAGFWVESGPTLRRGASWVVVGVGFEPWCSTTPCRYSTLPRPRALSGTGPALASSEVRETAPSLPRLTLGGAPHRFGSRRNGNAETLRFQALSVRAQNAHRPFGKRAPMGNHLG